MKKLIAMVMAGLSAVALADAPMVSNVKAQQRYPWNGLVDITCDVTGIDGTTNGLYFAVSAVDMDSGSTNRLSQLSLVQGGTSSIGLDVHTNGNYRILWDAYADLGEVVYSNIVLSVTIKTHGKVQLWEDGPYWAETNIGAENAWDSGYYFWWGDTVGYKRENNAWVAIDGSTSSFSFSTENALTYSKSVDMLQSEGWITSLGVLAPEHDAAHVQWGGNWRMPTEDELSALNNNCDWIWTTVNGVNGYIVRGRGDYASASIFLPASGFGTETSLAYAGSDGFGWSSVPFLNYPVPFSNSLYAYGIRFFSNYHGTNDFYRPNGLPVRPVQGFTGAQTTTITHAADFASFFLDTRTGVRESDGTETLAYSSLWDGGNGATVSIAQDGVAIADELTGEDTYAWGVTRNGTYVLTHTTYTNGVAGKVETATFVVTGKDVPFAPGDVTASGYSGKYDGVAHGITVQSDIEGFAVKYCNSQNGTYTTVAPTQTDVGSMTVWYEVSAPGYITTTNSATATITKRSVTLTSGSAGKVYDGTALVKHEVTVSGDGFVSGEGATYNYTGSQTGVGSSANSFAYTLNAGTKVGNYTITTANGTLTITKATNEWIVEPSISDWIYGQAASVPNMGLAKFGSASVTYSAPPQGVGTYTATFTVPETANYMVLTKEVTFKITSAEAEKLKEVFDGRPATVESDGVGGWKVTITNDIDSADLPIELPDNLGHVTIDLNGHDLVGADGAAGDSSTPGGGGRPAIRIVLGTGDGDTTRISLTTTGGDSLVKGGDGGAGNPGGNGAPAVEVADGARSGVKIDIGAGVTLQGGNGGAAVGDGASPGEDSPAMVGGEIGTNSGTLVKVKVPVPVIPDAEYTGSEVSPTVPASPLYAAAPSSGTQPGAYPVILTLSDAVCYEWLPRAGAAVSGAIATTTYTILEPPPTIVIDDGGQSGAANSASYVGVYDGEAHGVEVRVSNPATGWTVRYAASREGPYTSERPLYTDVVLGAETWYEVSAAGFDPVTNVAVVTITPRSLASAMLGSLRFDDAGGVRRPVPMLVDDLGHEVPPANYDFAWTEEKSGAMTLSFAGRGNYLGVFETRLAQTRFRVSFDANGGTVDTDGADYDIGTYYGLLPVPVRAGFLFDGWYEKADFSGSPVTRNTEVIAQDLTLHAKWLRRALWYTDATFHLESAATYDGYLIDPVADDAVAGTISVKAGKPGGNGLSKLTVTVLVAGEKKATLKSTTYDGRLTETVDGRALDLALGFSSMSGTLGRFEIDGSRNLFAAKDADSKLRAAQALKQWQGTYVVAWQDPGATANGWNGLSLVVGSKGKVTANGTLADGTKVSAKSQLLVGERECAAAVSWTKKGASVACLAWFCEDGSVECGNLLGGAAAKIANSRAGAYLGADAAFHVDADALAAAVPGLMGDLVPDGLSVRMKGSAFDIDKPGTVKLLKDKSGIDPAALGTNPSGLKLKYKMKDATFSGTFAAYSLDGGKLKKTTVQVAGVVLGGVGYGTASVKKSGSVAVTIK